MMLKISVLLGAILSVAAYVPLTTYTGRLSQVKLCATTDGGLVKTESTWQEEVDQVLNVDTSCGTRRRSVFSLVRNSRKILGDVFSAIRTRDIQKIAPPELGYGKAVLGMQAVRKQLTNDIIPQTITKGIPKVIEEGPKIVSELVKNVPEKGRGILSTVRDISQDPSMLQSTVDGIKREIKNAVKSVPEGVETPKYDLIKDAGTYQVRFYPGYSVCSTEISGGEGNEMADPLASGTSFATLADYIFSESFSMTTPVISGAGAMEFVLPRGIDSVSAPVPKNERINIKDVPAEFLAVREFAGFATDGEVTRQRAMLEDALLADGVLYDNLSFKVFQYNPPQTLPWLRRNEVALRIDMTNELQTAYQDMKTKVQTPDDPEFYSAPEAGD